MAYTHNDYISQTALYRKLLSEQSTIEQLRNCLNNLDNWQALSEQEKQDVRTVMALMGIETPADLLMVALREYVTTVKENPDRWAFPAAMFGKH